MVKCDMCGGESCIHEMQSLREHYRISDIRDLCPKCIEWANRELDAVRSQVAPELRRRIAARAGKSWPPSFWERLRLKLFVNDSVFP